MNPSTRILNLKRGVVGTPDFVTGSDRHASHLGSGGIGSGADLWDCGVCANAGSLVSG